MIVTINTDRIPFLDQLMELAGMFPESSAEREGVLRNAAKYLEVYSHPAIQVMPTEAAEVTGDPIVGPDQIAWGEIEWEGIDERGINPAFAGYKAAYYFTGRPESGWCLYTNSGGTWSQRTKAAHPPAPGLVPLRRYGKWFWGVEPGKEGAR